MHSEQTRTRQMHTDTHHVHTCTPPPPKYHKNNTICTDCAHGNRNIKPKCRYTSENTVGECCPYTVAGRLTTQQHAMAKDVSAPGWARSRRHDAVTVYCVYCIYMCIHCRVWIQSVDPIIVYVLETL